MVSSSIEESWSLWIPIQRSLPSDSRLFRLGFSCGPLERGGFTLSVRARMRCSPMEEVSEEPEEEDWVEEDGVVEEDG